VSSSTSLSRRLAVLELADPTPEQGRPFLFFSSLQTYQEALAFAGLADHDGPVFPIRVVGLAPQVGGMPR
jgi:hypothetical protein